MSRFIVGIFVAGSLWMACGLALAADVNVSATPKSETDETWEYRPTTPSAQVYKPNSLMIVQQKSMVRAQQRQDRLAAQSWYGVSASRPSETPIPYTSVRGPVWWDDSYQRPYAWYEACQQPFNVRVLR